MQIFYEGEQLSIFDHDSSYGRTCPEHSVRAKKREMTSAQSWRRSLELVAMPYQYLNLTPGFGNLLGVSYWEILSPLRGDASMLNTGVSPKDAVGSSLSQILQAQPHPRYFLSRRVCLGILRRAKERGKELPQQLWIALMMQAGLMAMNEHPSPPLAFHINQREETIDLGETAGALLATPNMQMQTFVSQKVYENHVIDARYTEQEVVPTISARAGTGGNNLPLIEDGDESVMCIVGNIIDRQPQNGGNGVGVQADIAYTITATDRHAVFARQWVDEFRSCNVASTQVARQHKDATDLVCETQIYGQSCYGGYSEGCATLRAEGGDSGGGSENLVVSQDENSPAVQLIRRLTPLECERLQGFPDGWTDVGDAADSKRYKALGNSVAIPCVEFVLRGIAMAAKMGV